MQGYCLNSIEKDELELEKEQQILEHLNLIHRRERRNLGGKFRRKRGGDDSANYGGVQRGSRRTRNEKRRLYKGGGMNKGVGDYKDGGKTSKKGMGVVIIVGKPKVKRKGKN